MMQIILFHTGASKMTDNATGLQWQDNDVTAVADMNWTEAKEYCKNTLALGGYTD